MKQVGCGVEFKHVGCGFEPGIFCEITLMVIYPGLMYYHLKLSMYNWTLWLCDDGLILCLWQSQGSDCTHSCHVSFDSMRVLLELLMQQLLSKCYCGVCSGIALNYICVCMSRCWNWRWETPWNFHERNQPSDRGELVEICMRLQSM